MLAVSGAFPLTSDQPPLAVISVKALTALMPGWDRAGAGRVSATAPSSSGQATGINHDAGALGSGDWRIDPRRNPFAIAGPPPSFEANVLEVERRFEAILARIELARSQQEMRVGSTLAEAGQPIQAADPSEGFVSVERAEADPGYRPPAAAGPSPHSINSEEITAALFGAERLDSADRIESDPGAAVPDSNHAGTLISDSPEPNFLLGG